jgi:hypothetical protein
MMAAEASEHVRFLTERLVRANRIERVEPELVDSLLDAVRVFVPDADPRGIHLAAAALEAIDRQNTITCAVLDDHLRLALEVYLSLPTPGTDGGADRRRAPAEAVHSHNGRATDRLAAHHTKGKS